MLIAIIYAVTGALGVVGYYTRSQAFAACLMETILALGTTLLALCVRRAELPFESRRRRGRDADRPKERVAATVARGSSRGGNDERSRGEVSR